MEIVVNDTNILIDLYNAGLLPHCKSLDLDFRTLDVMYLTDLLSEAHILSYAEMAESLELLLASNSRLPRKLIQERISCLREADGGISLLPNDGD